MLLINDARSFTTEGYEHTKDKSKVFTYQSKNYDFEDLFSLPRKLTDKDIDPSVI